jgi:hypothetical protein
MIDAGAEQDGGETRNKFKSELSQRIKQTSAKNPSRRAKGQELNNVGEETRTTMKKSADAEQ